MTCQAFPFKRKLYLFADSISKLFIWISVEVRSCVLQYVFLSTNLAVGFCSHYALEVVKKAVLTEYMYTNDIKFFYGIRGLFLMMLILLTCF